jgi:hypothetical protein
MHILTSVVQLQPGLYLLRHPGPNMPPLSVTQAPHTRAEIDVLTARASGALVLENGSDCIVMRVAHAPADLLVAAFSNTAAAMAPAMKVDRVALDAPALVPSSMSPAQRANTVTQPVQRPAQNPLVIKKQGVSIIGHVEGQAAIAASEGQVCGNPASLQRLEGFQLMWPDRPDGVDLAYSVALEGQSPLPAARSGMYVGGRGHSRRITEVCITLIGPHAHRFQLQGTAYFSGGHAIALHSGVPTSGPSGLEHLTALALHTELAQPASAAAPNTAASSLQSVPSSPAASHKRIARPKSEQPKASSKPLASSLKNQRK